MDLLPGQVILVTLKLVHQWLPCYASGIVMSAPRLVGPMSGNCVVFSRSGHSCESKTGILTATLPGTWHCRVSARTCWPGVSIL